MNGISGPVHQPHGAANPSESGRPGRHRAGIQDPAKPAGRSEDRTVRTPDAIGSGRGPQTSASPSPAGTGASHSRHAGGSSHRSTPPASDETGSRPDSAKRCIHAARMRSTGGGPAETSTETRRRLEPRASSRPSPPGVPRLASPAPRQSRLWRTPYRVRRRPGRRVGSNGSGSPGYESERCRIDHDGTPVDGSLCDAEARAHQETVRAVRPISRPCRHWDAPGSGSPDRRPRAAAGSEDQPRLPPARPVGRVPR